MPLPNDGDVRCLACGCALNMTDNNCWRCGSTKLEITEAAFVIVEDEQDALRPSAPRPSVLSDVATFIGRKHTQ